MPNIVRTVALLSRREGVSFEASCRYWREVHTPLAAQLPVRCVQRHVQAPRSVSTATHQGPEAMESARASEAGQRAFASAPNFPSRHDAVTIDDVVVVACRSQGTSTLPGSRGRRSSDRQPSGSCLPARSLPQRSDLRSRQLSVHPVRRPGTVPERPPENVEFLCHWRARQDESGRPCCNRSAQGGVRRVQRRYARSGARDGVGHRRLHEMAHGQDRQAQPLPY